MIYLDSNIIICASLTKGVEGQKARELVKLIRKGETEACTSYLTWDEVFWTIIKHRGFHVAFEAAKALVEMPNLRLINVDRSVIDGASELVEEHRLKPRDAIHAASAIQMGAEMLSEDRDFDKVKGLKRKGL